MVLRSEERHGADRLLELARGITGGLSSHPHAPGATNGPARPAGGRHAVTGDSAVDEAQR